MNPKPLSCALIGHFSEPPIAESALAVLEVLRQRGVQALVASDQPVNFQGQALPVKRTALAEQASYMVAVGGDGTLLEAARLVVGREVPLMGINRGRLGFLTDVLPRNVVASIEAMLDGKCEAERRPLLEASLHRKQDFVSKCLALNDVVLLRRVAGHMLDFHTHVDGRYLNTHRGDGLVVATATGSTAYALSCGGPIVDPRLDVLVMAPICPHTLSDRPIVVPGNSRIEVHPQGRGAGLAEVTCDGARLGDMQPDDRLLISAAGASITLLHPPGHEFFRSLRSKLRWGRGGEPREH